MKNRFTFRSSAALALCVLVSGCCGLLSNNDARKKESDKTAIMDETRSRSTDFSGNYAVSGEGYRDVDLDIKKAGKYYSLEWDFPGSEPARGVELSGYLCAYTQGEEGIVGIYKKQGSGITGLWLDKGKYAYESSKGTRSLEPSGRDFSGVYDIRSDEVGDEEAYSYRLTIEREGERYSARAVYEDGSNSTNEVVAVDGIIVMGFPQDNILVTKAFVKSGSRLKGKVIYAYPDHETGVEKVTVGSEQGEEEGD